MCGKRAVAEFALQLLPQDAESCAAIEYVDTVTEAHFDAGGIASIAQILGLWRWRGTAHAPELDPHRLVTARELLPWTLSLVSSDDGPHESIAGLVHSAIFRGCSASF